MTGDRPETRTGLEAWAPAELPAPPTPSGIGWLAVVGPGVIVLGLSIGSGEFLLGPAAFVRHGLSLLWVVSVAVFLQTIFNLEVMRYVMATGEPVFTGFMRTRPSAAGWAWAYAVLFFFQCGWPIWAGTSAAAAFFLFAGRLPGQADADTLYGIGVLTFLACVVLLLLGKRIGRTLEILNWVMVGAVILAFLLLAVAFVPGATWLAAAAGFAGFDLSGARFSFLPEGADFFLLGALAGFAGCGGVMNLALGNWARDKGYGMGGHAGYISAAVGGERVHLAHRGFRFTPGPDAMSRWRGWWRIARADQWGVFFTGALLGMALPALLYVTFLPPGTDIRGLGISAALAEGMGRSAGPAIAIGIAVLGVWLLFKSQLDILEGTTRSVTEILWCGSPRLRGLTQGDVRLVYYSVLGALVVWGSIALRLTTPVFLLQLGANVAGFTLMVASLHLLYVNTRLLPAGLRPSLFRRLMLVCAALFYGFFSLLAARSFLT